MKLRWISGVLVLITCGFILFECCKPGAGPVLTANDFTGSNSCKSCHQSEHTDWQGSHHYMAMQPPNDSTVFGDFNNAVFTSDGVTSKFFKKDGKYFINTQDEKGDYRDFEVQYTFGFTPLQQYLVTFPGGKMQATRASWDTKSKKWFHQYPGEKLPPNDWIHWTGNGQNWNTMCASCHSTNVNKGYDELTDTYNTTYNEINVSCESCHGPGKNHIDYINGGDYKKGNKKEGSYLLLASQATQMEQINMCGYCHARRSDITGNPFPGKEVMNDYIPEFPTNDFFFADGQMNDEDYNYTSFLQSKMFRRGVECSNCHNPHSNKLKLNGPLVCAQCHAVDQYQSEAHTMHNTSLTEVNCITCHMPSKIYMGNDLRHDHSFRKPRPDLTAKYGTPNTCNTCHKDKTAQWAADQVKAHFGKSPDWHFSDDLVPGSLMNENSPSHLFKLAGDSAAPNIVRAATLRYIGQLQGSQPGYQLVNYLKDSSAMVRYAALKSLRVFPQEIWLTPAAPLLQDPVKGVRIAAADLFLETPPSIIPQPYDAAFTKAKSELDYFIHFQTDFAQGNLQAGDYYLRMNDRNLATKYYLRAIAKDSLLLNARLNLATNYNALGMNTEALDQLELSARISPDNDHLLFTLGLLYSELGNVEKAEKAFEKATIVNPGNIRALYNYGLLLSQHGNNTLAERKFLQALQTDPQNGDVLYALTIVYLQNRDTQKATVTGKQLQKFHGGNPAYQDILRNLRLN